MMHEATTPQGKVFWLDGLDDPLIGSPLVTLKLREAATNGIQAEWPAPPIVIDLQNFSEIRFVLEAIYPGQVTFSANAPKAAEMVEPIDPLAIY